MKKDNNYYEQGYINTTKNSFLKKISDKIFKSTVVNNNDNIQQISKFEKVFFDYFYSFFGQEET